MPPRLPLSLSQEIHLYLILTIVLLLLAAASTSLAAEGIAVLPKNTISIAFDPANGSMTGTSKITLPPDTGLTLFYGNLDITGAILVIDGKEPLMLKPTDATTFIIPKTPHEQSVYVSWNLTANGQDDNLISKEGITLAGLWHPLPDIDMAYRLEARLPEGFTGISEGEIVAYTQDRDRKRYLKTAFDHPIRAIHFAGGPYTVKSRKVSGKSGKIELSAFFFPEDLSLADGYLDKAVEYLRLYEKMIGPYPYNRYSIVENRLPTGYGMPTFTLLGQAVVRLPFIKDTSLGHEILHSWFGNSIFTKDSGGNWSEGLTTYLADQYYAEQKNQGPEYRKEQLLRYASYVPGDNDMTLQGFESASHSQPLARQVREIGYDKGSMVFHMLRRQLGDEKFFAGLKQFYRQFRFTRAGWDEIEDVFNAVSGTDLADFFDQWLTRRDIPKLSIEDVNFSQVKGQSQVSFTIRQKNIQPYTFQLPVVIKTRNKEVDQTVAVTGQSQTVKILVDALPVSLTIDPQYDLMRVVSPKETPPLLSRFIGAKDKIAVLPTDKDAAAVYSPLLPLLKSWGTEIVNADDLDNGDLDEQSFFFLGPSKHSLGLFADPGHPANGATVDVRENPLAPGQVDVLFSSRDREQTDSITRKLSHYGKYSYLHFEDGRLLDKKTAPADNGIHVVIFPEPEAIRTQDIRNFNQIINEIKNSRVVYVGESHTDLGNHMLQLQVIQALFEEDPNLAIGMEMFPRSSQEALDQYINGTLKTEKDFLKKSRYFDVWGFDYRYYRDIIGYAKRNAIPLVGLNIDKAVVSKVFQEGNLDGLTDEQYASVPSERKLDAPGYRQRLLDAFSVHNQQVFTGKRVGGFIQAQSIWDETMAESIVTYLKAHPEKRMVILAGNGHVYKDSAIPSRVERRLDVSQSVITSIKDATQATVPGYKVDYLVYTEAMELEPAPKIGVILDTEHVGDDGKTRLRITKISPHGKAGEAGLKEGDIILACEGEPVTEVTDLKIILLDKKVGDTVTLKVLRKHSLLPNEELELKVELSTPMLGGVMPPSHPR